MKLSSLFLICIIIVVACFMNMACDNQQDKPIQQEKPQQVITPSRKVPREI